MTAAPKAASIWALAFPIILSNITIPLLGAVDAAVMGHMDNAAYLGAVALGGLIFDYLYWGFGFLRLSTTGLTAQALGAEDTPEARAIFLRATLIAVVGALFVWGLHFWIFDLARVLFEAEPSVEALMGDYFFIRIWSAPAALMNYVLIGWILAHKDTKSVLIQQVITNLLNVVLDLWFVVGLGFGIEGVAIATVIAQYCGMGVGLWIVRSKLHMLGGDWDFASLWDWAEIKRLLSMNFDLFVRTVCLISAFAWFSAQGAKLGTLTLAANAILLQFQQFTSYALDGFAHAVEILSGHDAGRKDRQAFRQSVLSSTKWAGAVALLFGAVYGLCSGPLIGLFTDLPDVLLAAESYSIWMIVLPIVSVWSFQLDGIYFGLTQTRPLRNMMVLSLLIYLPLSLVMINFWGNHGLWAAFTIFMGLRAITLGMTFPSVEKKIFG